MHLLIYLFIYLIRGTDIMNNDRSKMTEEQFQCRYLQINILRVLSFSKTRLRHI